MRMSDRSGKRGFAYILALVLLAVFSTLAVAFAASTDMSLRKSENCRQAAGARLAAESGLAFHSYVLSKIKPSAGMAGAELVSDIAGKLAAELDGTSNISGTAVTHSEGTLTITVPEISLGGDCGTFSATVSLDSAEDNRIWLEVTGRAGTVRRTVKMAFEAQQSQGGTFNYGLATGGKVILSGQATILSANNSPYEASILSTYSDGTEAAFTLTGQVQIDGEIYTADPDATVVLDNQVSVAGATGEDVWNHVHRGIDDAEFPEPNPSVFETLVGLTDMNNPTPPQATYTNIRILKNTNPTFDSDCVLEGVIFVEKPNNLIFAGKVTIRGVIVTEDARDDSETNRIKFSGQVESYAVDTLPEVGFESVKQIPGVFLLAPGFDAEFSGQFGTVNGAMVADSFTFSGQAGGTVKGPVISYSDADFNYSGQAGLTIDRSDSNELPSCLLMPSDLIPLPETYAEN